MNPFERQADFFRRLIELNTETVQKLSQLDQERFTRYVENNQRFFSEMPSQSSPEDLLNLQRTMAESVWSDFQDALRSRGEVLQQSMEEMNQLFTEAITPSSDDNQPPSSGSE